MEGGRGTRVRRSRMAHGEDARRDLLWAWRILAEAEGVQLLMDEEHLGQVVAPGGKAYAYQYGQYPCTLYVIDGLR